jgi:hypothetical protein
MFGELDSKGSGVCTNLIRRITTQGRHIQARSSTEIVSPARQSEREGVRGELTN